MWCLTNPSSSITGNEEHFEETRAIRIPTDAMIDFKYKTEKRISRRPVHSNHAYAGTQS